MCLVLHIKMYGSVSQGVKLYDRLSEGRMSRITYPLVWVREILRAAVEGFKVKGFLLVKGDHFGKWSSVILTEHLTLSVKKTQ